MPDLGAADLIVGFLLLITPVVFIHELGHYWVARKAGVIVDVFSVGLAQKYMAGRQKQAPDGVLRLFLWRLCENAR